MKKTLMVLTFALCATFVFAQTATPRKGEYKAPTKAAQVQNTQKYVSFTKDATPLVTVDFHAENAGYSTDVISTGLERHAENYDYATWRRWNDNSEATLNAAANVYPALSQTYFGGLDNFVEYLGGYLDTATSSAENGFMMMSTYDQRTPNSGHFNAYILIEHIDASAATVVDVQFFQCYRKYYDKCYIDYSIDNGSTWNNVEINTTGIDLEVNDQLNGMYTYNLPVAAAGSNNLSIRIRYKSLNSNRGSYGYFWVIDDVSVIPGEADRLRKYNQEYVEGNYGLIPMGLTINPAWYTQVLNNGSNNQSSIVATLNHLDAAQATRTQISSFDNGGVNASDFAHIVCDKAGWILRDSIDSRGWYGYNTFAPNGTGMAMPTANAGDNYIFANLHNNDNSIDINYDTMLYQVTTANANGDFRWGHDNGILTYSPYNYWIYGYVEQNGTWYVTEDEEEVHFYQSGYVVNSRYTTDATVPEGWVIRGVELVASPVEGYHSTGAKLSAVLWADQYNGGSVTFAGINTGANVKEVQASDINDSSVIGRNSNGYLTLGNYNTVVIEFPEQPALEPNTSYRIGYSMEEEGYFAVADEAQGSYRMASPTRPDQYDTILYFRNNEATAKYAHHFTPNSYQGYINDPSYGGDGNSGMFTYFKTSNPMIRMIVGPAHTVTRHNIGVECENNEFGEAIYGGRSACDSTITPAEGSTCTIIGEAAVGCRAKVYVDGVEIEPFDEDTETGDEHLTIQYDEDAEVYTYYYTFTNVQDDHQIKFEFFEYTSIDPVAANVRMSLKPNPATSQVNLNINGVNGMVNCVLIDMSGRVVYNQNINAENAQVIDLSNLAKGAYFVRITNDKFSKVEKLIVR